MPWPPGQVALEEAAVEGGAARAEDLPLAQKDYYMFCYQCEQTAKGTGCTTSGVCGKDPETAALQDLLVHATKGIAHVRAPGARAGRDGPRSVDVFVVEALFTTVTNVNFDPARLAGAGSARRAVRDQGAQDAVRDACAPRPARRPEALGRPGALEAGRRPATGWSRRADQVAIDARRCRPWARTSPACRNCSSTG